jgi:hypothetical protein
MVKARYGVGTLANIQEFGREVKARRAREADELGMTIAEKERYILSGNLPARFEQQEENNERTRNS